MVKFAFESYEVDFPNWAKHHKTIGIHVRREYQDGEVDKTKDETLNSLVDKNNSILKAKPVDLYVRGTGERKTATDYYLPLENKDLKPIVDYFQSGASNTRQNMGVRYKFLLESSLFILDHTLIAKGNYSLTDVLDIDYIVEEVCENGKLEDVGIAKTDDSNDYEIIVVDEYGDITTICMSLNELLDHLIAVELYDYQMEIID